MYLYNILDQKEGRAAPAVVQAPAVVRAPAVAADSEQVSQLSRRCQLHFYIFPDHLLRSTVFFVLLSTSILSIKYTLH